MTLPPIQLPYGIPIPPSWTAPGGQPTVGWFSGTWDWINDQIDTYIWDTDSDIAVVEGLIKEGVVEPAETAIDWLQDAWDWVNEQVDTYIWDTDSGVAVVEGWIKDVIGIDAAIVDDNVQSFDDMAQALIDYYANLAHDDYYGAAIAVQDAIQAAADIAGEDSQGVISTILDALPIPDTVKDVIQSVTDVFDMGVLSTILSLLVDDIAGRINGWFDNALNLTEREE